MRTPLVFSVSAHGAIILATLVAWPNREEIVEPSAVITVDTYTIDEIRRLLPMPEAEEEALEEVMEPVPDAETADATPPEETSEPEPEPLPEKAEVKPPKLKLIPPKPQAEKFDVARLEDMLLKDKSKKPALKQSAPQAKASLTGEVTLTEQDALRAQVQRCWRFPVGAPNPEELVVTLRIQLTQAGRLLSPPELVENMRMSNDPYYQVAVRNARQALIMCQPYKLPLEKYASWRDIRFIFNPRDMVGM